MKNSPWQRYGTVPPGCRFGFSDAPPNYPNRIYFRNVSTGDICYREAKWSVFGHCVDWRPTGIGFKCDAKGKPTGRGVKPEKFPERYT